MLRNFGGSTIVVAPSPATSGLTATVQSGHGSTRFGAGRAVWWPGNTPTPENAEVIEILSVAGDVLTLSARAVEGSTARAVEPGWNIRQGFTAGQLANLLQLDPREAGEYVGQVAQPPPGGDGSAPPWLEMQAPHSAGDANADTVRMSSTTAGGARVDTFRLNGNNEIRLAPSTATRVGDRTFEFPVALGGPSTQRFVEWSTNPVNAGDREPLLGGYGTGHLTKPGWVEATRVMSALLGVQAGGNYNGLTAACFRGRSSTTGAPTSGTWIAGDVILDSAGALWLCTTGGTPGTWVGTAAAATAFQAITPGASMQAGSVAAASRIEPGAQAARLRGKLQATGSVSSGATIGTITTAHRPLITVDTQVRYTGGGARLTITTGGVITMGAALATNDNVFLDSITYDLLGA